MRKKISNESLFSVSGDDTDVACDKISEVTETERTRKEYEDSIKRRHHRLMNFVDTHIKDDQIKKYIRVSYHLYDCI